MPMTSYDYDRKLWVQIDSVTAQRCTVYKDFPTSASDAPDHPTVWRHVSTVVSP